MDFTPLHRGLGLPPSILTDEILDAAVAAGVAETDDLDWKSELPPVKDSRRLTFRKTLQLWRTAAAA